MKLTDEQIRDCWDRVRHITGESPKIHALAREVEAEVLRGITGDGRGEAQRACETLAGCPDSNACREASQCQYGATPPQQEQVAPGAVQDGFVMVEKELLRQLRHYTICHLMCFPNCGAPTESEIDAWIAAAHKAVVQDGWMPIETIKEVPELPGSTPVLVFSTNQITSIQPLVFVRELLEISKTDPDDDCLFTHWMPLPSAPKAQEPGA